MTKFQNVELIKKKYGIMDKYYSVKRDIERAVIDECNRLIIAGKDLPKVKYVSRGTWLALQYESVDIPPFKSGDRSSPYSHLPVQLVMHYLGHQIRLETYPEVLE